MARRVHSHLFIQDTCSALDEAKKGVLEYPGSKPLRLALVKALCESGNEVEALNEWNNLTKDYSELLEDRVALETLAWSVINKGESSNQLSVKVNALIGAVMTRDARALPLILNSLKGSNSMLRSVAIGLASSYGDFPLQDEITRLLKEEKVWFVRLELIKAVGALKMMEAKDILFESIADPHTMAEEKAAATVSLVGLYESIGDCEISSLLRSNRSGLRELACQIITHLDLHDKTDLLAPLLKDTHPEVRKSVLTTLALLGTEKLENKQILEHPSFKALLSDPLPDVAITASWLALIRGDKKGIHNLKHWVLKGDERMSRLAAGALAVSGKNGVNLSKILINKTNDPYVEMTLAIGLIGQRENVQSCCKILSKHLSMNEKWMWDTSIHPLFRSISPERVSPNPQIANYPEVVNQITRLEILQILCVLKNEGAQNTVKAFLSSQPWGVVGQAVSTLLQEGDDEALDCIRELLDDPDEKIRLQVAMILAQLGDDKRAIDVLKKAYPNANRENKIYILQAIAKVGDREAILFLLERLHEPFQVLRVVAATAIIQCLYH